MKKTDYFRGSFFVLFKVLSRHFTKVLLLSVLLILSPDIYSLPDQQGITGTITDSNTKEPMPGVNIQVKGTSVGTISDGAGKYSLPNVDRNATLVFSFIGYNTLEVAVGGRTVVDAALVGSEVGLDEVVVIGYGTQKKETLTGSVASIKTDQILATKTISVAAAIQGKIPGVQIRQQTGEPGTFNSRISVRGFGEPLLVIDGVVRDAMDDFERLNPEDIESISVLKDAAASIYGLGAANGVFIVTTKKGFAGKTEFSLNTMYSVKSPTNDWSQINVDAYTMRYMWNEMRRNSEGVPYTSEADLAKWKENTEPGYTDYNWWENLVRKNVNSSEVTFNARGGNDVITFFSSIGYNNDGGYFKNNELEQYDRYTFRTNVEGKLAKGLKLGVSFYGRYEDVVQPTRGTTWTFKRTITNDRGVGPYTLDGLGHYTMVASENTNVFAELSKDASGYVNNKKFQYQSQVDINYDIPVVKGLALGVTAVFDGQVNDNRTLYKNFILYDYISGAPKTSSVAPTTFNNQIQNYIRKEVQSKLSYRRSFGQHNIATTLVYQIRRIDDNNVRARRQYDDLYTTPIVDQGSLTNQLGTGSRSEQAFLSYIGRLNYDFRSKYLLEVSFREDGSYRYAPSQRWGFFPAFSAGWRIGQEQFFKSALPMVSDFKLRASWGKSGRDAGNPFQYYEGYTFGNVAGGFIFNPGVLTLGMVPPGVVNSNLSWVNTTTADIGFDLDMWKGKLGLIFDVFKRNENGLLATRASALPNTFGANFPQENLNSQWQQGYDMSISHRNTINKFSYGITGTLTYTRTYLKHQERSPNQSTWDVWKNGSDTWDDQGRITGRVFGQRRDGIFTNVTETETAVLQGGGTGNYFVLPGMDKIIDTDGNGVINGDDQLPIMWSGAGTNPPLQFGTTMNASYRNFSLTVGLAGSSLFTMAKSRGDQWGYGTQYQMFLAEFLDRWHTANDTDNPFDPATQWIPGKWEALTVNSNGNQTGATTDKWRMDATYLRIKTVELGYNVPVEYAKFIGLSSARVYVNGYNLFTFANDFLKDMDPERDEGAFSAGNTYPIMRSFNFGLNVKF
ncbi:MAG TPA: TonB-dependent receptor [Bacteroidales bacterium]|nr:TonB-dependent receptor [Bacteroidales bacterium]